MTKNAEKSVLGKGSWGLPGRAHDSKQGAEREGMILPSGSALQRPEERGSWEESRVQILGAQSTHLWAEAG